MNAAASVGRQTGGEPRSTTRRAAGILRVPLVLDSAVFMTILVVLGMVMDEFTLSLMTSYVALALMAIGLDLIWGYTGILSFGQAGFFGLGAYGFALCGTHWHSAGFAVTIAIGLIAAVALAAFLGWFVFFSRVGVFFIAVITLAVAVILEQTVNQFSTFTGGLNGINLEVYYPWSQRQTYFFLLLVLGVALGLAIRVVRSDAGQLMLAIRDDEERARFLGFSTPWFKTGVLVLSSLMCAAGGILYVIQTGLVSPTLIGFTLSTQVVIWTAIGGRGTLLGPVIGAIAINYGQQQLSGQFLATWQLALGVILVLVVAYAPEGLYARFVTLTRRGNNDRHLSRQVIGTARQAGGTTARETAVLTVKGVSQTFGSFRALTEVSFELAPGELVGLIGPNGAGKSTLVDVVTGRRQDHSGQVILRGKDASGWRPELRARSGMARTFQAGTIFDSVTVFDNLSLAARDGRVRLRNCLSRARILDLPDYVVTLLGESGLDQRLADPAGELSHGEKKWLELCMVLAQEPAVILLDEPTAGLTQLERAEIATALREIATRQGVALLLIEHDLEFVRQITDRILVLNQGKVAFDGNTDDAAASSLLRDIYLGPA